MKAKALLSATTGFFFGLFTYLVLQYLEMEDALLISVFGGLLFYLLLFIFFLVYGKMMDKKYAEFEKEMIRRNMSFGVTEQPEVLMEKLNTLRSAKKKGLIYVCSGVALMFIIIFITVFLTGEREMHEFSNIDWTLFAIMVATEIATAVATFYFAGKTGKNNIPIEKLQYEIQRRNIETQPLLPGFVIAVYTDENYTGRITLFGYPNDSAVYYSVQEFASDYTLFRAYTSDVYGSREELPADFETLIDITDKVLH